MSDKSRTLHVCPKCGGGLIVSREEIWRYPVNPVTGNMLTGRGQRYSVIDQGARWCVQCDKGYRYISGKYVPANE